MGIVIKKHKTSGAALITVLIMVFIVMAIISNITIQNYRTIRRLANQSFQDQAVAVLKSTVAFARAGLATSGATSSIDALSDIWAQPMPQTTIPGLNEITMSGYLQDEQSKFNINELVTNGAVNQKVLEQFANLLNSLNIPRVMASGIAYYMASPTNQEGIMSQYTSGSPAYRPAGRELLDLSELLLVKGMQPAWVFKLNQYVTAISSINRGGSGDTINVNTASPEVIAARSGIPLPVAQRLVTIRYTAPFKSVSEIKDFLTKNGIPTEQNSSSGIISIDLKVLDVKSSYFTVHALVTSKDYQFKWVAMLYRSSRDGQWPTILWQHPE